MPIPYVADKLRCSECRSKKIDNLHNLSHDVIELKVISKA